MPGICQSFCSIISPIELDSEAKRASMRQKNVTWEGRHMTACEYVISVALLG